MQITQIYSGADVQESLHHNLDLCIRGKKHGSEVEAEVWQKKVWREGGMAFVKIRNVIRTRRHFSIWR